MPRTRVLFAHGLESSPSGAKVRQLRQQGFVVTAPDLHMSLFDIRRHNSAARCFFSPSNIIGRWPTWWFCGALEDSFSACVDVMTEEIRRNRNAVESLSARRPDSPHRTKPNADSTSPPLGSTSDGAAAPGEGPHSVLVGSSWGGAVAAAVIARGEWHGPAVLLCPALQMRERRVGALPATNASSTAVITAALAALPAQQKAQIVIVHGTVDETVPLEDSRALAAATGIRLELAEGGDHALRAAVSDGRLAQWIHSVL